MPKTITPQQLKRELAAERRKRGGLNLTLACVAVLLRWSFERPGHPPVAVEDIAYRMYPLVRPVLRRKLNFANVRHLLGDNKVRQRLNKHGLKQLPAALPERLNQVWELGARVVAANTPDKELVTLNTIEVRRTGMRMKSSGELAIGAFRINGHLREPYAHTEGVREIYRATQALPENTVESTP